MSDIHKVRILGSSEIECGLDIKKDYSMALKRLAVKNIVKKSTDEDENFVYTYTLENLDIITIIDEGQTIKGKAKSASKKLRGYLYIMAKDLGVEDSESFYQKAMNYIIVNGDEVLKGFFETYN